MKEKPLIKCECGKEVVANTIATHLRNSKKCHASKAYRDRVEHLSKTANLYDKRTSAWLKKEGTEAQRVVTWFSDVLNGKIKLEDLSFESPRPRGEMTLCGREKISKERMGANNPMSKPNPYGVDFITEKMNCFYKKTVKEDLLLPKGLVGEIIRLMSENYPDWQFGLELKFKNGKSVKGKQRIVSYILSRDQPDYNESKMKFRGKRISQGQKASETFSLIAAKLCANNLTTRVTKTEIRLLELLRKYDSEAESSKQILSGGYLKIFDCYSPKYNALIEMHGHVFHDVEKSPIGLRDMAERNVKNDAIKQKMAYDKGYRLWVFWDDEEETWEDKLKEKICSIN